MFKSASLTATAVKSEIKKIFLYVPYGYISKGVEVNDFKFYVI